MLSELLTVERTIPSSVLAGLATGDYSLHGGVVRNATGQIVRHLVPTASQALDPFGLLSTPFEIFNTYQIHDLKKMSEQVLAISSATMAMSGLNLAVSAVGFAVLHQGLKKVDRRLKTIGEDVAWIKRFLEDERHAALLDAAQDLENLPVDIKNRNQILHNHRSKVGQVAMQYLHEWDESVAGGLLEEVSCQHYYCTAFLMKARCSAELGMYDNAMIELHDGIGHWRERSQCLASERILGEDPHTFMGKEYLSEVPAAKLIEWMDFARNEKKGWGWVDELREKPSSSRWPSRPFRSEQRKFEEDHRFEIMDSLVKRSDVLDGYEAQYKFLTENKIAPSQFEKVLKNIVQESAADDTGSGVLVLVPGTAA